jgi:hypothetical protein
MSDEEIRSELSLVDDQISVDNSPLLQADPKALDELFSRIDKSLKLDQIPDSDTIDQVVMVLRRQRAKFISEEAIKVPGTRGRGNSTKVGEAATKVRSNKTVKSVKEALSLDDL